MVHGVRLRAFTAYGSSRAATAAVGDARKSRPAWAPLCKERYRTAVFERLDKTLVRWSDARRSM
jgi:hypothetical protein